MSRPHLRWLGSLMLLAGIAVFVLLPTAAGAQEDNYPVTTVTTNRCVDSNGADVCGTSVTVPSGSQESLPFTGGDVALLTVLGLGVAGAGAGLVWFGRRADSAA